MRWCGRYNRVRHVVMATKLHTQERLPVSTRGRDGESEGVCRKTGTRRARGGGEEEEEKGAGV